MQLFFLVVTLKYLIKLEQEYPLTAAERVISGCYDTHLPTHVVFRSITALSFG